MSEAHMRVAIAGGGIAGLATAIAVRLAGHVPRVYERRLDPSQGGGAMLMWPNGFAALDSLGLGDRVRAGATEIRRVEFRTAKGRALAQWRVGPGPTSPVRLVFRSDVLAALLSAVPEEAL